MGPFVSSEGYLLLRGLGDHALEHALRAREPFDLLLHRGHVLLADGGARLLDDRRALSMASRPKSLEATICSTCGNSCSISAMSFSASCLTPSNSSLGAALDQVVLGVLDHLLDLVLGEAARRGDLDRLLWPGLEVLGAAR